MQLVIHLQMLVVTIKIMVVVALVMTPTEMFCGLSMYGGCKMNWTEMFVSDPSLLYHNGVLIVSMCYIALAPPQSGYQLHGYANGIVTPFLFSSIGLSHVPM